LLTADQFNPKNIAGIPVTELARQLTLIGLPPLLLLAVLRESFQPLTLRAEYDKFAAIKPHELLKQAWLKSNKATLAPNVLATIARFNLVRCAMRLILLPLGRVIDGFLKKETLMPGDR
jgi:hypothetical protein